jgi:RNA polymerase sigma-70 factor (ECF subfamily)
MTATVKPESGFAALPLTADELSALRDSMYRFAMMQIRDPDLAEDAVQDALASACVNVARFDGRSALKTWIFAILKNKIIDLIRQRNRTVNASSLSDDEADADSAFEALFQDNDRWTSEARPSAWSSPEDSLEQQQFWAVFEACLNRLPENTARVFMMREILELETGEICSQLAISNENCYVILHRARNSLRLCLDGKWFGGGERRC